MCCRASFANSTSSTCWAQNPSIGVVDHPLLDQIRAINARAGVPTIITTHNIESLDVGRMQFKSRVATQRIGVDFGNELWSLSHFAQRLTISKVEAAILNGVGLSCGFYPYVPCGEVRERLQTNGGGATACKARSEALPADGHRVSRADAAVAAVVCR